MSKQMKYVLIRDKFIEKRLLTVTPSAQGLTCAYNSLQQIPADPSRHLFKEMVSGDTFQPVPPYRCRAHLDRRAGGLLTQRHKKEREAKLAWVARVFVAHATSGIAARTHDGSGCLGVAVARLRLLCTHVEPFERRTPRKRMHENAICNVSK
jgi:hypothetical protein